jgi:hypothetical protein
MISSKTAEVSEARKTIPGYAAEKGILARTGDCNKFCVTAYH